MAMLAVKARITGRVQGVAFRAWTRDEAERNGLVGWVRNEPDGSVQAMLDAVQEGPPAARVADVQTEDAEPDPAVSGFRIVG